MRALRWAGLGAVLAIGVVACGESGTSDTSTAETSTQASGTQAASTQAASEQGSSDGMEVRVITQTATTQGTWDPANYAAYKAVADESGWKLEIAEAVPYGRATQVLNTWGEQGVKAVFLTDAGFEKSMLEAAKRYPDTKFITMSNITTTDGLPNVAAYTVDWCQAGLIPGFAAALGSEKHNIAAMQGLPIPPAVKEAIGIEKGAEIAVPGTKVKVVNFNSVSDPAKAASATTSAMGAGADVVVANVLGATAPAVASTAQKQNGYYIGAFADESKYAPKAYVTTAAVDFLGAYRKFAEQLKNDTFEPKIVQTTLASGEVKLLTPFHQGLSEAEAKAVELEKQARDGKFDDQLAECENAH